MYSTKSKTYSQVSLSEIKEDLRIAPSDTYYDSQINRLIKSAIHIAESFIGFDIVPTTTVVYDYDFYGKSYFINQPNCNVTGVTVNDVITTGYTIEYRQFGTVIKFNDCIDAKTININYRTGYNVMPYDIQRAVSIKVAELFDVDVNGYVSSLTATNSFERILSPHKNYIY